MHTFLIKVHFYFFPLIYSIIFRWSIMSVESSTAGKEEKEDDLEMSPVPPPSRSPLIESGLSTEQKEHLLQQVEQLQQDLDEKFIGPTVVEKSDHEKLGE